MCAIISCNAYFYKVFVPKTTICHFSVSVVKMKKLWVSFKFQKPSFSQSLIVQRLIQRQVWNLVESVEMYWHSFSEYGWSADPSCAYDESLPWTILTQLPIQTNNNATVRQNKVAFLLEVCEYQIFWIRLEYEYLASNIEWNIDY